MKPKLHKKEEDGIQNIQKVAERKDKDRNIHRRKKENEETAKEKQGREKKRGGERIKSEMR